MHENAARSDARKQGASRDRLGKLGLAPRGLSRVEAAAYVGLSPGSFAQEVAEGRMPGPMPLSSRRKVWDRAKLDSWMNRVSELDGDHDAEIVAAIEGASNGRGAA